MPDNVTALAVVPTADPSTVNAQDVIFLQSAQMSNLTEVAEAELALRNTANIQSREFARWMIGDHAAQIATLSALAEQLGVTLSSSPSAEQQSEIDQLSALKGLAFDQAYGPPAVQDHAQTIALFQHEVAGGENPALVALAQQSLPLLNAHYEQAEVLAGLSPAPYPGIGPAPAPDIPAAPTTLSAQDQTFVVQAATSGLAEVAEGQIAEQRGNNASSEFGRWMVADHAAVNASLATIAQQEGFVLPAKPTPTQQDELTSLSKAPNFDAVYSSDQVLGHVKTLMTFIKEAEIGSDPALVAFARSDPNFGATPCWRSRGWVEQCRDQPANWRQSQFSVPDPGVQY
jgi:putative membrane protein